MKIFKFSLFKYVAFFFIFSCSSVFSSDLVEEGWRYHKNFKLKVKYNSKESIIDLAAEHNAMAEVLRHTCPTQKKYTCLLRFIPVIIKGEEGGETISFGDTIFLTEAPFHVPDSVEGEGETFQGRDPIYLYNELGFISGSGEQKDKSTIPHKNTYNFKRVVQFPELSLEQNERAFSVFPTSMVGDSLSHPFALKLVQRNYVNAELLIQRLDFRYPDTDSIPQCFHQGNYQRLYDMNQDVKKRLREKPKKVTDLLETVKKLLLCGDVDKVVDLVAELDKEDADKNPNIKHVNGNKAMNSYGCAEQCALDFLWDTRVISYLQRKLSIFSSQVKGIIINAHCSHTPCCSCATAFSREVGEGGVFKNIFYRQRIFFMGSAHNPYERKSSMIPYKDTQFIGTINIEELNRQLLNLTDSQKLEELKSNEINRLKVERAEVLQFKLDEEGSSITIPYPIVLMEYNEQNGKFEIHTSIDNQLEAQVTEQIEKLRGSIPEQAEEDLGIGRLLGDSD